MDEQCSIEVNVEGIKALETLKRKFGTNTSGLFSTLSKVTESWKDGMFKPSKQFTEWFKETHNGETPDFNNNTGGRMTKAIEKFVRLGDINVASTAKKHKTLNQFAELYTDSYARTFGIQTVVGFLNDFRYQDIYSSKGEDPTKGMSDADFQNRYANAVQARLKKILMTRIVEAHDDMTMNSLKAQLRGLDVDVVLNKLHDLIGGEDASYQDQNLFALVNEFTKNKNFLDDALRDGKVNWFKKRYNADELELDRQDDAETNGDANALDGQEQAKMMADSDGQELANPNSEVDVDLKIRLSSIKKLNSTSALTGQLDYDTDNPLGIPARLDVNQTINTLRHILVGVNNMNEAINRIKSVASVIPDRASYSIIADWMENDSNFANRLWNQLASPIFSKAIFIVQDGTAESRTSNARANNVEALFADFSNSTRNAVTSIVDNAHAKAIIEGNADWLLRQTSSDNVYQLINDVMTKDPNEILNSGTDFARANVLLHNFADSIRTYLPNISEAAVINYIKFNKGNKVKGHENEPDWANNVYRLKGLMSEIANGVQKSAEIKANNELEADFAHRQNYALDQKLGKVAAERNENYIDEAAIRHRDFMSPTLYSNIASLAKEFNNYMITDINITSMNANRKQTSDAIDNSKVTEIMRVVGNHEVLAQYAPLIQKIAHSRYSTILIEHDGLFGLFRQTDKGLVPTDYAEQLIHTSLFNGIQDRDNGGTSVYNQMVTSDYVATAYTSFFHPNETQFQRDLENKGKITFGSYFMRTPADAPKQFMHTAPRYRYNDSNVGELFTIANKDEVDTIINNRINAIKSHRYESGDYPKGVIDSDEMTLHFNSDQTAIIYGGRNKNFDIRLEPKQIILFGAKGIKNGNEVKMLATNDTTKRFKVNDDFIVSGILDVKNKRLTHIKLVGVDSGYISTHLENTLRKKFLKDAENDKDKNGNPLVQRSININHPIYKAYRSAFLGELREAATAMQKFFELDDKGKVVYYTGLTDKYIKVNGKYMTETDYNHSIDEYNKKHTRKKAYAKDEELVDLNGQPVAKGGWNYEDDGTGKTKIVYHPEAALDLDDQLATGAYDIYHVGKSGKVIENGELTGRVFTSDKFELAERNYGNEVMQRYFNPFYRGADAYDSSNRFVKLNPDGSVELTDKQEDAIQDMINNYVTDYVNQSLDRFDKYKQFVIDDKIPVDFEHVAEIQTNYNIAFYNYNELYEGNTKFYENSQDLLKRSKEGQAGGKLYAMADFLTPSYLLTRSDDGEIYSGIHLNADGTTEDIHIPMRKKFNAITINNVVRTDPNVEKELIAQMKKASPDLDPKIAEAIIKSAHKDVKRNDAQSFITFEEWIRRIAGRGQLKRFKPLIDAIYDESKPVNAALINEFIQPMKNVYYDTYYDEQAGIMVPRFVKNAEFVLIPRFIKGTQFESVYKMMKDNDIDQLNTRETTKAGKHNVLTLWDNDGNMPDFTSTKPKDVAARKKFYAQVQGAKEEYDYRYLYTQQEPVQHINTDNKISVQIVKKIIDNIDKNSPLAGIKDDFFNVYTHKIKRSFESLMDEFNIKRDDDGHIIVNEQGVIEGVDYTKLLNRLQEEALRNGLDSNLIDYFTQAPDDFFNAAANETGFKGLNTLMPLYDSATSVKTQSVVNAIFNSSITRQKINGFHGTQITNIGFQAKGENVKKSKWLHYHQDKDHPYMEIAMTYKAFGIDVNNAHYKKLRQIADAEAANTNTDKTGKEIFDEMIIDELTKDGLDKVVAYRMPTEGKQSMTVAKIVHFLDDTYGSTVVVPDEWVAQTGSDFDIDSVYGIQHKSYYDADGRLRRYEYKTEFDRKDYNKYAYNKFVKKLAKAAHISKDEARKRLAEQGIYSNSEVNDIAFENTKLPQNQKYDIAQMHAQVAYKALSDADKEFVKEINRDFQRIAEERQTSNRILSSSELFVNRLRYIKYKFNNYLNSNAKIDDASRASINKYLESNDELIDAVKSSTEFDSRLNENKETLIESNNAAIDKYAAENGIESETDYIGMSTYDKNEDYALDNKMVDDMLEILEDPSSREENLSSSTFANITGDDGALQHVLAVMTPENKAALHRTNRSAYNFLDQADMMNDTMGGARLKAFSVTRDTFCSVCNTVHPYLNKNDVIKINYNTDRLNKGEITHDSLGWFSHADKNINRNIVGYLLTPYSSQTSAHAFDAVKAGVIPNVNEYTFATYKLFPEIGSDYDTAVSFIMQPGISRIVDAYERSKSVFSTDNRNPIYEAVKSIAIDLGIKKINVGGTELETEKAPINTVVEALQTTYGEQFKKVLGGGKISLKDNAAIKDVALNVKMQFRRFQRNLDDVDAQTRTNLLLWDLGQILQFNRLNSIATRITNLARVCNPDKFGAKQSIFTTNKVFDDIQTIIKNEANSEPTLIVELEDNSIKNQKELDDIKAKAISDGTFMKAPNGKPTNLDEYQWLQTRTKAFKNWFGDWENDPKNASKVVDENGEPLVVYHGSKSILNVFDPSKFKRRQRLSQQIKPTNFFSSDKTVADFFAITENQILASKISASIDIILDAYAGENVDENTLANDIWTEAAHRTGKSKEFVKDFWENKVPSEYKMKDEFGETRMEDPDINKYKYNVFLNMKSPIILDAKGERADRFIESNKEVLNNNDEVIIININETVGKKDTATDYIVRNSNKIKSATGNVGTFSTIDDNIYNNRTKVSFLKAIYPNVDLGLDGYITSTPTHKSSYQILDSFLRYATASSIKVARPLYKTESKEFRDLVYGIENVFDNTRNTSLDESTYYDFSKYILGDYYRANPFIAEPQYSIMDADGNHEHFGFDKSDPRVYETVTYPDPVTGKPITEQRLRNPEDLRYRETRRIYGYGHGANITATYKIKVKGDDGKLHDVERQEPLHIKDINHPTKDEFDKFVVLSPAQKVRWIQEHTTEDNLFKHLSAELDRSSRATRHGQQTITLNSDDVDTEILRDMFEAAIFNNNPIIADAAMDLIKYSYLVEGRKMQRGGITDIIRNTALYNTLGDRNSRSIIQMLDTQIEISPDKTSAEAGKLYEDYIRSHSQMSQIAKHTIDKINNVPELTIGDQYFIVVDGDKMSAKSGILEKYSLAKYKHDAISGRDIPEFNHYVRLRNKGSRNEILYKIVPSKNGDTLYLMPLNKLETNEHGEFSANSENNKFPSQDYYYQLIEYKEAEALKVPGPMKPSIKDFIGSQTEDFITRKVRDFDWNKPTDDNVRTESKLFPPIIEDIDRQLGDGKKDVCYVTARALNKYFDYADKGQASLQVVYNKERDKNGSPVEKDGKPVNRGYYFVRVQRLPIDVVSKINDSLAKHNVLTNELKMYQGAVDAAKKYGLKNVSDVYKVVRHKDTKDELTYQSSVDEVLPEDDVKNSVSDVPNKDKVTKEVSFGIQKQKEIESNQMMWNAIMHSDSDPITIRLRKELNAHNVTRDVSSIEANTSLIAHVGAKFAEAKRQKLNEISQNFPLPNGHIVSMTSKELFDVMEKDTDVRDKYLGIIGEALQFVKDMQIYYDLNITSMDEQDAANYKKIQDAVQDISSNSILQNGYQIFADNYLKRKSTNPLVQDDIITMTDGTFSETFLGGMIEDVQANGHPIVQTVTKIITDDIATKDLLAIKRVKEFNTKLDAIIQEARKNNESCTWDDVIDENNRLRTRYNNQYVTDYNNLQKTLNAAKAEHGEFSIEALRAQLAMDKWLTANTHREIIDLTSDEYFNQAKEQFFKERDEFNSVSQQQWINNKVKELKDKLSDEDKKKFNEVTEKLWRASLRGQYADRKEFYSTPDNELRNILLTRKGYYEQLNDLTEDAINRAPEAFSKYKELTTKRNRLYAERINGLLNENIERQIDALDAEIKRLTSLNTVDPATGDLISKREYDEENPYSKDPKVAYRQRIESLNSATIINDYIKKTKELRNQFYTEETDEKFKKDLDERLAIINKYEQRNGDGKLIISRVELAAKHKDYADALQWMHRNTRKEIKSAEDIQQEIAHRTPEEIEQRIIQGTSHIKLTNDERHYVDDDGTLYNRVTSVIQSPWERFPEDSPWKTPSTTVGTGVDTFLRDFFDDNLGDINTLAERYPNATQEDWMKLYNDLQPIKKIMKEKHLKAIPKDVTLKGQVIVKDRNGKKYKLNVAGTLDLLLYDKDGNFYIYDFKTHHVSNKPGAKPQPLDSNIGKMVRYSKQVSLYKQFLENEYHIKVKTLALMPIRVHYPDPKGFGEGITEYEAKGEDKTRRQLYANGKEFREANPILEKSIPINFTDVKVRYEDLPEEVRKEAKEFTEEDELVAPDFDLKAELTKAFETLRGSKSDRKFYKDILNLHPDIRDEYGNVDARKLSDVEIAKIKSYQERNLTTRENNVAFTDRTIINSAPNADEYYTGEFYEGLRVGGISNPEYREIVAKFNKLVQPYYDNTTHRLLTSRMTIDELKQMKDYLDQLDGTKSKYGVNKEAIERAQKFRKENIEIKTNRKAYDEEERNAKLKGSDYYYAWLDANGIYSQAWHSYIPNDRLYGYFVPKESVKEKFIDKKRTRAAKLINKYYETTTSPYFNMKWNEVAAEAKGDTKKVQDWYEKNTVYNPRTHEREPLMCWRTMELKDDVATTYTPKGDYVHRKVRDKFVDHNFHGFGAARLGDNYKDDGSHRYQSKHKFNASQLKLIDFIQHEVLDKYTGLNRDADELTYNQAQRFAMKGQMPIEISQEAAKSMHSKGNRLKDATTEAGRALGDFLAIRGMKDIPNTQPQLSYYMRPAAMPMTELLKTKNSIVKQPIRPERANYQDGEIGDREYRADMNNYIEEVQERQRINLAENAKIASKDWRAVLGDFITKSTHHNAIMDNRQMLWYLVQMTSRDNVYDRNSATLKFKRDNRLSTEGHPKYVMTNDENTRKQVETWFRRMYLDEWKEPTSQRLNRLAMYLQNFTSSTYMMLNIKGGIENVTTGLVNIGMEAFAQDYLGFKDFALASGEYSIGIPDYIKHIFDGKADTLQGAIIKTFNVVDFERMNNLETNSDYKGIIETLRDWAYSPQSMGEHYMQNTVLFAMLKSHRLILDPKTNGYRYMNMAEYTRDSAMIAMKEYLDELSKTTGEDEYQKLIDVVEKIKADPNVLSKYVWFRRDLISDYATFKLTPEQQKAFLAKYDEIKNKAEETFADDENHPTFYSQLELGEDGELHFKAGSKMAELDRISEKPGQPSEAIKLMGAFKNRVIFTNKKIHGVYDKLGGAQIEKYVWGSLVMQYHKHLYPGIMKHWRRQGYYNEVRGTIEKGCYTALLDFLAIPFDKVKFDRQLSDEDVSAWQGFQNILKSSFDYLRNIKTCWNLLPDYERANIRRNLGDMSGLFASFFAIFALRMFQDNTSTDNFAFNLAMYEFDKLQMNSTMYTPWMAQTEFRTQWSSPIAAQSIVEDLTRTIGELAALAIEGDSYDGYYHSGIYSGQFRPAVYLQRRLPIYRQYYTMSTLNKNNKAYHIGDNTLGFFGADPKEIAESIRGVELDN